MWCNIWKMLCVILVFSEYPSNYNVTFKIINRLKVNNDNFKFNCNFKRHITVEKILEKHLTFSFLFYIICNI
jgi:hypothetical protein